MRIFANLAGMSLITLESLKDLKGLQAKSASNKLFVLYFHAEWSEASKEMTPAIMELASDYASSDSTSSSICIASVDADGEKVSSFDKLCQVKVVPAVVCVVGDNAISKVEGLNVPLVVSTISECLKTCASLPGASATSASSTSTSASATPAAPASETKEELETRMKKVRIPRDECVYILAMINYDFSVFNYCVASHVYIPEPMLSIFCTDHQVLPSHGLH